MLINTSDDDDGDANNPNDNPNNDSSSSNNNHHIINDNNEARLQPHALLTFTVHVYTGFVLVGQKLITINNDTNVRQKALDGLTLIS